MPSSQMAASERRNNDTTVSPDKVTLEPPKLKTTLKTPPKQATNPLQFVKVGPCSLYRTAQEQLQKVQEVKKIKQEIRDDPEDWQSNLDNWKSSRRKRQEHIIERVVEVKKLELEEHDRQRRRSKTFSEMMEERGNRGRKLSISLAMYSEEDANDLSDLGIGTSSGKSSVSGDTHDDTHSVLSDRDSEVEKNHSDIENVSHENGNDHSNDLSSDVDSSNTLSFPTTTITTTSSSTASRTTIISSPRENKVPNNDFHKSDVTSNYNSRQEYDSGTIATTSLSEPEEYTYESAIRGYVSRVSQNIPRRSLADLDMKFDNGNKVAAATVNNTVYSLLEKPTVEDNHELKVNNATATPLVKVDILKRREIFEKALRENIENKNNNNNSSNNNNNNRLDFASTKSIKERLSSLERQNSEIEAVDKSPKHSIDSTISVRERFNRKKQSNEKEGNRDFVYEELEGVEPLRERLSKLDKITSNDQGLTALSTSIQQNGDFSTKTIKDRLTLIDADRCKEMESCSTSCFHKQQANIRVENSTSSERSSSPDSEYRAPRATFHQSLDSLDADASSGPDTFERVQSLEELDYHQARRYPASSSSAEILNDTDREDSGIHTADVSCSVSQADEPIEEEIGTNNSNIIEKHQQHQVIVEEKTEFRSTIETTLVETLKSFENVEENNIGITIDPELCDAVKTEMQTKFESQTKASQAKGKLSVAAASQRVKEEQQVTVITESLPPLPLPVPEMQPPQPATQTHLQEANAIHQQSSKFPETPTPLRPTTLALERTTLCSDFLSPLSPVSKQILPLSFSSDEEIVTNLAFPLGPPTSVEPPKEKPPPPPVDLSDEENHPIEPLKRLNSTRRIKKELRTRRSDFLGIEGFNDDELERELTLTKPPDMAAILAEERRIEQLHRRSYDTDSNYEQDSSHERDSGVELGQAEDWAKQAVSPDMSQHSRQSSEPFGASITSSEEDEITKKEREIIEVLEREEQWRYENNREINSDIGEKLAHKLRELEEEKMHLERERASQETSDNHQQHRRHHEPIAETLRMNEENLRKQEELTRQQDEAAAIQHELEKQRTEEKRQQQEEETRLQEQLQMQKCDEHKKRNTQIRRHQDAQIRVAEKVTEENKPMSSTLSSNEDEYASREVLRVERELLQLEQEELMRQRNNLAYREQKQQQLAEQLQDQWKSLQNVAHTTAQSRQTQYGKPQVVAPPNYRSSMPNLQMQETSLSQRRKPPPPPIPPAKPLRLLEQRQRDVTIKNSRIPSADSIPQQVEAPVRPSCSVKSLLNDQQHQSQSQNQQGQQMSRQTLQALSAVPRPRIVQGDQWVQRRKSDIPRGAYDYNYQHWLIQEAEQRRINEKNQRSPVRKQHVTSTSVPYTASPARPDSKPLPDSIIQTLTQRVQNRVQEKPLSPRRRLEHSTSQEHLHSSQQYQLQQHKVLQSSNNSESQEKMLSVSGKKKCSHCGDELGRGAAMIIESLRLFYHMECFKCCVCHVRLGDGLMGTDVRVRNHKLHCHNCYSSDDGVKFSCV